MSEHEPQEIRKFDICLDILGTLKMYFLSLAICIYKLRHIPRKFKID